ncbi:MAG: protein kinase, partial [Pirellulaceae bacterium]
MNASGPQAKEIFVELIGQVPPEQWEERLAQACGNDDELRRRVEALLKAHREPDSFLEQPANGVNVPVTVNQPVSEHPGTQIGPYKLLQQIGEGGMGTVYMAEQSHPVQRKVALKVIKPGMDSGQVIARFEAERQALALMDHPNIARVLDAGTIGEGARDWGLGTRGSGAQGLPSAPNPQPLAPSSRPYFVMELVHGVPITKYCDDN